MLVVAVRAEAPLSSPDVDFGFVTWLEVTVREREAGTNESVGTARVAIIRVAEAMNYGVALRDVLDRQRDLRALYDLFFDPTTDYLKQEFHNAVGWNVIYFDDVEVTGAWRERHIEEAAVKRVIETWGETLAIAVIRTSSESESKRWQRVGFVPVVQPNDRHARYACLDLSRSLPDVRAVDREGHRFEIKDRK